VSEKMYRSYKFTKTEVKEQEKTEQWKICPVKYILCALGSNTSICDYMKLELC
jgi:hypothetical protein